ncbi:MAG: YncE family protein [Gemmatimonadaceae bacterium]
MSYRILAGAESEDEVALIQFTPCAAGIASSQCGARVVRTFKVGVWPYENEGPHGVIPSTDGNAFYVTLAHGIPLGRLQKFDMSTGELIDDVELGMFPATVDISPDGALVYAINFNFEDPEMKRSSLSIVDGSTMTEIARVTTCRMPHGSRVSPDGSRHYSACMMNDLLVEVDTRAFELSRLFNVAPGSEGPVAVMMADTTAPAAAHAMAGHTGRADEDGMAMSSLCSPTWAQPSADGAKIYVACNKSDEIVEVDVASWTLLRRWDTPPAPYNLAATPDGELLIATQKGPGSTTIWRLSDAKLLADISGGGRLASGVAVSGDSRYAFVTLEGVGADPGVVDIIDLRDLETVASVEIGKQAGGIAVVP